MREIQLRAWGNNEMYYFDDADRGQWTCSIDNGKIKNIDYWSAETEHECDEFEKPPILMQYTGLKDKNGKKLYEGDIIKYEEGIIQEVKFGSFTMPGSGYYDEKISAGWYLEIINYNKEKENNYYKTICLNNDVEIIGNIYENKDLLACA